MPARTTPRPHGSWIAQLEKRSIRKDGDETPRRFSDAPLCRALVSPSAPSDKRKARVRQARNSRRVTRFPPQTGISHRRRAHRLFKGCLRAPRLCTYLLSTRYRCQARDPAAIDAILDAVVRGIEEAAAWFRRSSKTAMPSGANWRLVMPSLLRPPKTDRTAEKRKRRAGRSADSGARDRSDTRRPAVRGPHTAPRDASRDQDLGRAVSPWPMPTRRFRPARADGSQPT